MANIEKIFLQLHNELGDDIKEKIRMQLVNKKALAHKEEDSYPYRNFLDLVVIYRICSEDLGNILVTDEMMVAMDMTEADLYQTAYSNMESHNPIRVSNMDAFVPLPGDFPMYVITNQSGIYRIGRVPRLTNWIRRG